MLALLDICSSDLSHTTSWLSYAGLIESGLYTLAKHRPLINLAYGDLLLFAVSNAQIMSAFVISPGTLPSWYWHWIRRVGTLDVQFLLLQGRLSRNQLSDMTLIQHVVDRTNPRSVGNERRLQAWLSTPHPFKWPHAPCHLNHPMIDNCLLANLHRAGIAFKSMLPTYAILHLIPALLFRSRVFMKSLVSYFFYSAYACCRLYRHSKTGVLTDSFVPSRTGRGLLGRLAFLPAFVSCRAYVWNQSNHVSLFNHEEISILRPFPRNVCLDYLAFTLYTFKTVRLAMLDHPRLT